MPKSLKSQGFSEEEIIARKREQNRLRQTRARVEGRSNHYSCALTKEYSDKLNSILETHSLTFSQFIRDIIDGKITISFPSDDEDTK